MPAFCVMIAFVSGARGKTSLVMGALVSFSLALSVLAGERINLLLRVCSGVLAFFSWKINVKRLLAAISIFSVMILPIFIIQGGNDPRFTLAVLNDLPTGAGSDYYRKMGGGILAFLDSPLVGIGTANYRDLCPTILAENNTFRCDNHPHNYFIQMLAETGVLGFATGVFMICTIIWTLFRAGRTNKQNVAAATAFIVPLGLFFPLQSTADFFGQWNNIFMWSAVALSMASVNLPPTQNQTHK